jgi:putative DNA primase/helicase
MSDAISILEELVQEAQVKTDLKLYLEREEAGDAELFASMFQKRVVFDNAAHAWFLWTGNHWKRDRVGEVRQLVITRLAAEYGRAGTNALERGSKDEHKAFRGREKALLTLRRIARVLELCESHPLLRLDGEEWDLDPMVLGVNNGVIDLQTGTYRAGSPGEYLRAHAPTDWLGIDQPAPQWDKFIREIFAGDEEMMGFIQRLAGYCITGTSSEHRLPILYAADGRSGRTTMLETIAAVLGTDLSYATQADMLMNVKRDASGPQPFVYALRGKRLVWASESREGQQINAGLAKQLTGGDRITTRTHHQEAVTFKPTFTVMLLTNHRPHISADDQAMWDRVLLIEFNQRFIDDPKAPNEHKRNQDLPKILQAESAGILAWLVRGCLAWQQQGLCPPAKVLGATESYRDEEDTIQQFIDERCILGPGVEVKAGGLYKAYQTWTQEYGIRSMSLTAFGPKIKKKIKQDSNFEKRRDGIYYLGIGLLV